MNKVVFHPEAKKFLRKISKKDLRQIVNKLELLQKNPFSNRLDIKRLATKNSYRLRVGTIRVIYELHLKQKIIYIRNIDFRGGVY